MKVSNILSILDQIAPFELQEKWDNSGLLIGSLEDEFEKIYLSLDISSDLVKQAKPNSLFITHHPLIFDGLKSLNPLKYPSNIIYEMIKKDIKLISLHTNADKAFLNRYVVEKVLGYEITESEEFVCYFEPNKSFKEFYHEISNKLSLDIPQAIKCHDSVKKAALCTGSGASLLSSVKADCFLTGDIKYHSAFEAKENNLSMIDIGHYQSEIFFAKSLSELLKDKGINAIISNCENPFTTIKGN